jgi:hypothetical protein
MNVKVNSEMNQPNVIVKMDTMISETKKKIVLNVPLNVEPVPKTDVKIVVETELTQKRDVSVTKDTLIPKNVIVKNVQSDVNLVLLNTNVSSVLPTEK